MRILAYLLLFITLVWIGYHVVHLGMHLVAGTPWHYGVSLDHTHLSGS